MAESGDQVDISADEAAVEANYVAPAQKTVQEILEADKEDESLKKYKESLLGANAAAVVVDESNPSHVIVRSLELLAEGREPVTMKLDDLSDMSKKTFVMKEGCKYQLRISFHVQREIVAGLKYLHKINRHGLQVDKDEYMVGSYPPRAEIHTYTTPEDEAPSGMVHRGTYKVKSLFTDDDKHEWLKWEWTLDIRKDWD